MDASSGESLTGGSSYRSSFTPGHGSSSYGRRSMDEAFDASINFGDEISFGDGSARPDKSPAQTHNRMVEIFLAEDNNPRANETFSPTETTKKRRAMVQKCLVYFGFGILFLVIFMTVPQTGFMTGGGSEDGGENQTKTEDEIPANATEPEGIFMTEGIHVDMDRHQALRAYILERKVSTAEDLNRNNSPAALAWEWIASSDSAELDVPGYANKSHNNNGTKEEQGIQLLQRYALACLYFGLQGRPRSLLRNLLASPSQEEEENRLQFDQGWTVRASVCDWFGVTCNAQQYVTKIDLKHTQLKGTLAPEIFQEAALPHMTVLDLSHNSIQGGFPSHPFVNNQLAEILLENNRIKGNVDTILPKFPRLVELNLADNQVSGRLPEDWTLVPHLEIFEMSNNKLSGSLPPGIGILHNLEALGLDGNRLTGTIPDYANCYRLHNLNLARNQMEGTIPDYLGDQRLIQLSLQDNRFTGGVPASLGKLSILQVLHLELTDIVGTMPEGVCNLTGKTGKLKVLTADCNAPEKIECSCCSMCY